MSLFVRAAGPLSVLLIAAGMTSAATPKEIDAAIKKGTDSLRMRYAKGVPVGGGGGEFGVGPTCLAGLALLEGGVPITDPALKVITETVRNAAYGQVKTYQVSLCLMYLDRLGDPADEPLIQILAVRLLVGQSSGGGWSYECTGTVPPADEQRLRTIKGGAASPPKLNPDVERYGQALAIAKAQGGGNSGVGSDDNSNTQFAVIAVWLARKHGVPVDGALEQIERKYLTTQNSRGGWAYSGGGVALMPVGPGMDMMSSPAMYCAGLIGLATGVARREERRAKSESAKKDNHPKVDPKLDPKKNPDDPFFNPPPKGSGPEPKKPTPPRYPPDDRDRAVQGAFAGLGGVIAESARAGQGALVLKPGGGHGKHDLYFFWSVERTCVIYGIEKLGGVDWYEAGAHTLVHSQGGDGAWINGGYDPEINTSFAVLFLCRSNLARDLSSKVQKETVTEMRNKPGPDTSEPKPANPMTSVNPNTVPVAPVIPGAAGSEAATVAAELLRASDKDWAAALGKVRDARGSVYTQALVVAVSRVEGDRLKSARGALAERLTRFTADTLRAMARAEDAELRRAAVLAMAMKGDNSHLPDLIAAILDDEELVVRAARAGLKSLTEQDFGPSANASVGDKKIAAEAWQNWLNKQKK